MLLGTLLRRLEDERFTTQVLFSLGDITLAGRIGKAAAAFGETPGEYAANACARFGDGADDEDWLALMTALERGADPAATCLRAMVEWALKAEAAAAAAAQAPAAPPHEGCGCGGHGGGCGGGGDHHGPG